MSPAARAGWRQTTVRRVLRPLDRPAQPGFGVITAYRDGIVTLRSNRREDGYTFSETENGYQEIRPGDLVFHALDGFAGAVGVSDSYGNASPVYHVCEPVAGDDPGYLACLLRHLGTSGFLATQAPNVRERSVDFRNWSTFARIPLVLPPAAEQRAIADYLDRETARIDTLIDEQQRLIEMLCERRRAAVEEAVSIVGTSGPRLKHIIRSVRQGWSPQCYSWSADGVETWAVLKAGAANGGRFRPMENKELPEDEIPRPDIVVTRGDLIVSRANTRELVGSAAVVEGDFPRLMLCDKLYAFSLDERRADSRFVATALGSRRWRDLIELEATGASHSMLNISQSDIVNLPMPLPPVDEQRRIIAHLDSETAKIDQLIAETERFIELARERRSALVTAAVTGQIDVREVA
ncbi:restriction endonuclease subunit S [Sphaerisporangium rhizosphaerae]|uniref:Restriction endonuclease subunit S n=1 Tax=Sphaerisporangium rhizosphaerae TaxID=2269375 RepID=A0ABW2PER2_9ACTN